MPKSANLLVAVNLIFNNILNSRKKIGRFRQCSKVPDHQTLIRSVMFPRIYSNYLCNLLPEDEVKVGFND
jgi:hypothetical protein